MSIEALPERQEMKTLENHLPVIHHQLQHTEKETNASHARLACVHKQIPQLFSLFSNNFSLCKARMPCIQTKSRNCSTYTQVAEINQSKEKKMVKHRV